MGRIQRLGHPGEGQVLGIDHPVDQRAFGLGQLTGARLDQGLEFVAVGEQPATEGPVAGDPQQGLSEPTDQEHRGREHPVDGREDRQQQQAKPVGHALEQALGKQLAHQIDRQAGCQQHRPEGPVTPARPHLKVLPDQGHRREIGHRVAHEDGPEEILGTIHVGQQPSRIAAARTSPLADPEPAEGEDPGLHARKEERHQQPAGDRDAVPQFVSHSAASVSTRSSRIRRSSA